MEHKALGNLAVWQHPATGKTKGRVLHIHGISEHSGRHLPTVEALNQAGYEVVRFDLTGAGLSGGDRQYVARFSDYVDDVSRVYNWISSELPKMRLFVMGHSLGGAIALHYASRYGNLFHGLILSAPGFRVGGDISPLKIFVGKVLVRFFPKLRLHSVSSNGLSRDPEVAKRYQADPLSSHFNTLKQGDEVLKAFEAIPDCCKKISNPTLIVHGTADKVILAGGSFEILQKLGSKNKELHYLPGGYHEPHLDLDSKKFFLILSQWLDRT